MNSYPPNAPLIHRLIALVSLKMRVYRYPMKKLLGRLNDMRHERYIARLGYRCGQAMGSHDRIKARLYWSLMLAAIQRRSPNQVARMEQGMVNN